MPVHFSNITLKAYLDQLASREPIPGGGSAAALAASLGLSLISMVSNYSIGRKSNAKAIDARLKKILFSSEVMRKRLLELVSLDSEAYLNIVKARNADKKTQAKASRQAASIGKEICCLCYKALDLTPFLVGKGNPYLMSDVEVAVELLHAAFASSMVMVRVNNQ